MTPLVLIILDGWGIRHEKKDNGIALARTPNFTHFLESYPHTTLEASGPAVGLPQDIMGNSEVGHMNLGAGRIVYTGLSQIYQAIEDGSFFSNPALLLAIRATKKHRSRLHLMGLVSDGAVHSHEDHLDALLELAKRYGLTDVFIHCFTDGRDTPPRDAMNAMNRLEAVIKKKKVAKIASVSGRYYAMDRDKRWDRLQKTYDVLTGITQEGEKTASEIIRRSYEQNRGDEFIVPQVVLQENGEPVGSIRDHDAVIFFNFRADRARELTQALTNPSFKEWDRKIAPRLSCFVCMAPYDVSFNLPVAFTPQFPKKTFGEVVSAHGLKQLRIAETEKYAHVTFFFSGGREKPFENETRILIPSPREVSTYDQKPEMAAKIVTDEVCKRLQAKLDDVIILNFANPDMVGHTAISPAIVFAVETVDDCLGKIIHLVLSLGGQVVVTADHGNAEQMVDRTGKPHTAHTLNPVPFLLISDQFKNSPLKKTGRLCDVVPTLLEMIGLSKPPEMTGKSLLDT